MNIQKINSTLTKAILQFQDSEIENMNEAMAGDYSVPTPGSIKLGGYQVPQPSKFGLKPQKPHEELDQEFIASHATRNKSDFQRIFDQLKPKQQIWVAMESIMGGTRSNIYQPYTIGRKSSSKKYRTVSLPLLRPGQVKAFPRGVQIRLTKRPDGTIGVALGDMAASLKGIYVPPKKIKSKR